MANSLAFDRIMQGLTEAIDYADGKTDGAVVRQISITGPDARAIREKTRLSQDKFARILGLSPASVRNWEQGRRAMDASTRALYLSLSNDPLGVIQGIQREAVVRSIDVTD
jgi:putative transcriptional regulator